MNEVADDLKGEMEEVTADQLAKYAHRVAGLLLPCPNDTVNVLQCFA